MFPDEISVTCGDKTALFKPSTFQVVLDDGTEMTGTAFERYCGLGNSKKWKTSIRIGSTGESVGAWLESFSSTVGGSDRIASQKTISVPEEDEGEDEPLTLQGDDDKDEDETVLEASKRQQSDRAGRKEDGTWNWDRTDTDFKANNNEWVVAVATPKFRAYEIHGLIIGKVIKKVGVDPVLNLYTQNPWPL